MSIRGLDAWITGGRPYSGREKIRCIAPQPDDTVGCGWTGVTETHTEYGATDWAIEECPDCGGEVG